MYITNAWCILFIIIIIISEIDDVIGIDDVIKIFMAGCLGKERKYNFLIFKIEIIKARPL